MNKIILYSYWRSSASWRVRWALHHKNIAFEYRSVNLLKGEQKSQEYASINPHKVVPAMILKDGSLITESMAMLEYLEEAFPKQNPLLPLELKDRAIVRQLSLIIAAGIHPLQNLKLLNAVAQDQESKSRFARIWIQDGLEVFTNIINQHRCNGSFCFGDNLSFADLCLIPQLYNARRHNIDTAKDFPLLNQIENSCKKLASYEASIPENQIDKV